MNHHWDETSGLGSNYSNTILRITINFGENVPLDPLNRWSTHTVSHNLVGLTDGQISAKLMTLPSGEGNKVNEIHTTFSHVHVSIVFESI